MIEQRTQEWFEARKGKVTASSVGAILGLSPFMKPDDVMRNMVRDYHNAEREFKGNVATEYGTFHENMAKIDYEMEMATKIRDAGFYTIKDKHGNEWLGASPDGFVFDGDIVEIKCPYGQRDNNPPAFKTVFEQMHYYAQVQIQMHVTHADRCYFYQWSQHGSKLMVVMYDESWIDEYLPRLYDFYLQFVKEIDNPIHLQDKRVKNDSAKSKVDRYFEMKAQIDELTELSKSLLADIVEECQGVDSDIDGHKLTKVIKKGSISYAKAVKDLLPNADLSSYMGESTEYWRLS